MRTRQPENRQKTGSQKLRSGRDPSIGKATQFKPGESGNPGGRPKDKPILEALRDAITRDPKLTERIAIEALKHAKKQLGWFAEVRNMLDGRPTGSPDDPINFNLSVNFVDAVEKR